jgi:hypothetical protein
MVKRVGRLYLPGELNQAREVFPDQKTEDAIDLACVTTCRLYNRPTPAQVIIFLCYVEMSWFVSNARDKLVRNHLKFLSQTPHMISRYLVKFHDFRTSFAFYRI